MSWLKGRLRHRPDVEDGREDDAAHAGSSPFETLPQLASENPASTLNPFLQGLVTALTNTDSFTGQKYRRFGANSRAGPIALNDYLLSYLGLPIRHVNRKIAAEYAAEGRLDDLPADARVGASRDGDRRRRRPRCPRGAPSRHP